MQPFKLTLRSCVINHLGFVFFQSSSSSFVFYCSYIHHPSSTVHSYVHTSIFHLSLCIRIPLSFISASMFKNASSALITSFGTSGSVLRRNKIIECFCQDDSVFRTVTNVNSVNYGRKFLDCRNYRNHIDKGCNFLKWLGDEFVDEGDLKLERQKKKINKLKNEVIHTKGWLKMSIVVKMLSLRLNLVFVTKYFN